MFAASRLSPLSLLLHTRMDEMIHITGMHTRIHPTVHQSPDYQVLTERGACASGGKTHMCEASGCEQRPVNNVLQEEEKAYLQLEEHDAWERARGARLQQEHCCSTNMAVVEISNGITSLAHDGARGPQT